MDAASPAQADSSPSIESETVHSIAAGLSEMAEAVQAADDAAAAQSAHASHESLPIPPSQSLAGQTVEPESPRASDVALPSGDVFEDLATPDAQREQFCIDVTSPSIEGEITPSIAVRFDELAEAVRAADVATAAPSAEATGESFVGQTRELELPRSSDVAPPIGGILEDMAAREAQGVQLRAAGEFPTPQNRSDETPAGQHFSQAAWGD